MENNSRPKTVFSGVQPTGAIHIGNYFGAIRNWKNIEEQYNGFFSVVDLHALTIRRDPSELKSQIYLTYALLLAAGLSPEKSTIFVQSHVPKHAELSWILGCYTMHGELARMTQFKDKSQKNAENINAGLFTYPVLMAADILLYSADLVPVGQDQKQHVELARDIALRFNGIYGDILTVPQPLIPKIGAKIMSLLDPAHKMSKSDPNLNASIFILDDYDSIIKKFKRAVTDSGSEVKRGEGKDGINNLISIYSAAANITPEEVEALFEGKGYGAFKVACGEVVADCLKPFKQKVEDLLKNKDYLDSIMKQGAQKADEAASVMHKKVYQTVGL